MKRSPWTRAAAITALAAVALLMGWTGCSKDRITSDRGAASGDVAASRSAAAAGPTIVTQNGDTPPAGIVSVATAGQSLRFWPYTGAALDGVPSDPVNVIFVGKADPVRLRAALLALDGDRTAFGFPPAPPFDARWSDANGSLQSCYAEGEGWQGSVVQLALGSYASARVHLRLFRTGIPFGEGGTWTVGSAHFEVLIPGTADHQVLSWELAQQIVMVDMMRTGLLDPGAGAIPSDPITAAPSFRSIPAVIYNELPIELRGLIGGPLGDVTEDVPLPNDGVATILNVTGEAPVTAEERTEALTLDYGQIIPKPFCSDGPLDYVLVSGPVGLTLSTTVDAGGAYEYHATIRGRLTITPIDVTVSPPAPAGEPYEAEIGDLQQGVADAFGAHAQAHVRRIAPHPGGSEMLMTSLRVSSRGSDLYQARTLCP